MTGLEQKLAELRGGEKPVKGDCDCDSGVCIMVNGALEIERCDECARFESDEDAMALVEVLLKTFTSFRRRIEAETVADGLDAFVAFLRGGEKIPEVERLDDAMLAVADAAKQLEVLKQGSLVVDGQGLVKTVTISASSWRDLKDAEQEWTEASRRFMAAVARGMTKENGHG